MAWVIGRHPESHNAMSGHSGILADRFYTDVYKLTENEEYTFHEIFPSLPKPETSADKNELKYAPIESFATLTCRGIDGTWTGAVDISSDGYLYVDDMIRDRTESLNPQRLENRYQDYLNVLVDRKNDGSKELMVGTRWNVLDPLGRVESENKDNPRYRFRKIPALNENGESNFQYKYGVGFSTEYYLVLKNRLDKNEWMAKYQQRPFVRGGLLFPEDELNYYNGVPEELFWDSCPTELRAYEEAHREQLEEQNMLMWMNGMYISNAIMSTIGNSGWFRGKNSEPNEYPKEPFNLFGNNTGEILLP